MHTGWSMTDVLVGHGRRRTTRILGGLAVALLLLTGRGVDAQAGGEGSVATEAAGLTAAQRKQKAKGHFTEANRFFGLGKYPEAALEYRRTLQLMPTLANPHKNQARCYLAMKDDSLLPDVAYHLLRYLQLKPDAPDAAAVRKDLEGAVRALGLAGRANKSEAEVSAHLEELGTAAAEEEQWAVAVTRFEQLRYLNPRRSELLKLLAESYLGALRCDDARRTYRAYLLVRPEEKAGLDVDGLFRECSEEAKTRVGSGGVPGKLVVISNVSGVVVLVDGKRVGNTPLDGPIKLPPGDHQVALFKEGYETVSRKVSLGSGATEQLELKLVPFDMGTAPDTEAPRAGGGGPSRVRRFSVQPQVGLIVGLGGAGGTAFGPSFGLAVGVDVIERLTVFGEVGFHSFNRTLSAAPPFEDGQLSSIALPLMVGATYRHPLGPVTLVAGLAGGMMLTSTGVAGDAGDEAQLDGGLLAVRGHLGGEFPLGPGGMVATASYMAHPLNQVDVTYQGAALVDNLVFGGPGLHVGYRFLF